MSLWIILRNLRFRQNLQSLSNLQRLTSLQSLSNSPILLLTLRRYTNRSPRFVFLREKRK